MSTTEHKKLDCGQLWSGESVPDFPAPGTRVFWDVGDRVPATVLPGHQDYGEYRHCVLKLDRAPDFWNCKQWHENAKEMSDLLPTVDAAGVELTPIDKDHREPVWKEPYFGFLYACLEARRKAGRQWKEAIRRAWFTGNYVRHGFDDLGPILQRLRNQPNMRWFKLDFKLPFTEDRWWGPNDKRS